MTYFSMFLLLSIGFAIIITNASGINHVKNKYQGGSSKINEKNEKLQLQSQRIKLESVEGKRYFKVRRSFSIAGYYFFYWYTLSNGRFEWSSCYHYVGLGRNKTF